MAKVKVEVLAENLSYSYKNEDGTHTREDYVRGQVFEMEEKDALAAAEGEEPKPPFIGKNSAGTEVWMHHPKTPRVARAAVRILKSGSEAKLSKPVEKEIVTPAPAPKPADPSKP
jgi:hypothetical protein